MKKGFIIFLAVIYFSAFAQASINSVIKEKSKKADVSGLMEFYEALSADEKPEQIRDWAFFALGRWLNAGKYRYSQLFYDKIPLRYGFLKDSGLLEIEDGRVGMLSDSEWIVILPAEKKSDRAALSRILDRRRASTNLTPSKINIFSYSFDPALKNITIDYAETLDGKTAFSPECGYFEKEVKNAADFTEWISSADDFIGAKYQGRNIVLYGRKYPEGMKGALAAQDVAAIYQAYFKDNSPEKEQQRIREYNVFISRKYDEVLRMNKGLRQRIQKGLMNRKQIMEEIKKRIPYETEGGDANVGFSLDPQKDFNGLSEDLLKMSKDDPSLGLPREAAYMSVLSSFSADIAYAAQRIKSEQSLEPLLKLRRKLQPKSGSGRSPADLNEYERSLKWLDETVRNLEMKNSYQSARYDGSVKGTEPAMALFYTDLVAKLWALNFNNTAPVGKVTGFRAMPDIKVSKIFWDEFIKLSNTRLWFGLRQENFNIYGKKLLMSPVATRVYAASSDPLFPGKESQPNSQSADFLGWWDAHYAAVADYENYYHKLNQIQKWACLFMVLNEEKNRSLDFLLAMPVDHSADFKSWYKNNASIKIKTQIPFADSKKFGKDTECLLLMSSNDYPLMGQYFFLSGGVSLASKKDILSKLGRGTAGKSAKTGTASKISANGPGTKPAGDKIVWTIPVNKTARFRGDNIELPQAKNQAVLSDTSGIMKLTCNVGGERLGTFSASEENNGIKLEWAEGEAAAANNLVEKLARRLKFGPDGESFLMSLPGFESVTKGDRDGSYILKPIGSKKRIYLTMNTEQKALKNVYYVRAAGSSPDADIFTAEIK